MTKTQLIQYIAEKMNSTKAQVSLFLETLSTVAELQLRSEGKFVIPDLAKFTLKDRAAKPERMGVNPHTKQPLMIAAKPASKRVAASVIGDLKKRLTS